MKTLVIFALVMLLPVLIYSPHRPSVDQVSSDDEVYEVYSAAIKELYLAEGEKAEGQSAGRTDSRVERLVVIRDHTTSTRKGDIDDPSQGMSVWRRISGISVDDEMIRDFERRSKESVLLEPRFKLGAKQVLISDEEFYSLIGAASSWSEFYKRYPRSVGYVLLSRVGFNRDHNQALIYIGRACGGLCGEGYSVLLAKNGGGWSIKQKMMLWIS